MLALEVKHFFRQRQTHLILSLALLSAIIFVSAVSFISYQHKQESLQQLDRQITNLEQMIQESGDHSFDTALQQLQERSDHMQSDDWSYWYQYVLGQTTVDGELASFEVDGYQVQPETVHATDTLFKILQERQLPYAFPMTFVATPFEKPETTQDKETVARLMSAQLMDGRAVVWSFLERGGLLWMIIVSCLLFGSLFVYDRQLLHPSRRWLMTSSVSQGRVFRSRLALFVIGEGCLLVGMLLLLYLVAGLWHGFGQWDFPMVTYVAKQTGKNIIREQMQLVVRPFYELVVPTIVLYVSLSFLWMAVIHWWTSLVKQPIIGSFLGLATGGLAMLYQHPWNPFSYWRITQLVDGSALVAQFRNHWNNPYILVLIWGVVGVLYLFTALIERIQTRR